MNFLVKKREKQEIFSFADFHLKTHISPFFQSTVEIIIYIAVDVCIYVQMPFEKAKFIILAHFITAVQQKYYPYPHQNYTKSAKILSIFSVAWTYTANFAFVLQFLSICARNTTYKRHFERFRFIYRKKKRKMGNFSFSDYP